MGLPARPAHPGQRGPAPHPPSPPRGPNAKPKSAVLEVMRSDNGDATYRLLIDGVPQKLGANTAKWDDASPWESGTYDSEFSKLRGKYDAFLIEYPPNRSQIKFHLGTETGHSEGCIVTRNANIVEIEKVLADNGIPKANLKFDVRGDFPIGFKLSIKNNLQEVERGKTLTLSLEVTGGGAPGGVSKDIWFHIVADHLDAKDFALVHPEKMPLYVSRSSYSDTKKGIFVRLPKGDRTRDYEVKILVPHAAAKPHGHPAAGGHHAATPRPPSPPSPPAGVPSAAPDPGICVAFSIDNYKILNKAPGPPAYFYTPSNYKMVLSLGSRTDEIRVKPAAASPAAVPRR